MKALLFFLFLARKIQGWILFYFGAGGGSATFFTRIIQEQSSMCSKTCADLGYDHFALTGYFIEGVS